MIKSHPSEGRDCFCMSKFSNFWVDASLINHNENISITPNSRSIIIALCDKYWLGRFKDTSVCTAFLNQQNVLTSYHCNGLVNYGKTVNTKEVIQFP